MWYRQDPDNLTLTVRFGRCDVVFEPCEDYQPRTATAPASGSFRIRAKGGMFYARRQWTRDAEKALAIYEALKDEAVYGEDFFYSVDLGDWLKGFLTDFEDANTLPRYWLDSYRTRRSMGAFAS